jgi:hypothetical protein
LRGAKDNSRINAKLASVADRAGGGVRRYGRLIYDRPRALALPLRFHFSVNGCE